MSSILLPPYSDHYPWSNSSQRFDSINQSIQPEWKSFFEKGKHAQLIIRNCGDHTKKRDIEDIFVKWKKAIQGLNDISNVSVGKFDLRYIAKHLDVVSHLNYYNYDAFEAWFFTNQINLCPPPPGSSPVIGEGAATFENGSAAPVSQEGCSEGGLMPVSLAIAYLFWDFFKNNKGGPSAGSGEGGKILEFKKRSSGQKEMSEERILEAARIGVGTLGVGIGGYLAYKIIRSLIVGAFNPPIGAALFFSPA